MKKLTFLFLLTLLPLMASAQAQDNLVDRVSRAVGVRLPDGYEAKVKEFVTNNKGMKSRVGSAFTEQFIIEQLKNDWGINKQNQLLFVWDAVYEQRTKKQLYIGEDGNKARLDEFEKVMEKAEACGKKYSKDYDAYLDQVIAEADREIIKITYDRLKHLTEFYRLYKRNPSTIMPNEISQMKNSAKHIIANCKEYNIDYKAELRKELGDDKKVAELLKFFGVE